jgi:hypothetical protein
LLPRLLYSLFKSCHPSCGQGAGKNFFPVALSKF